mmetsp:Transcript_8858/g.11038  ORF Transcript_8858/g.11038 Transcript_8858/m.11038 type:complete len:199 (+) Transcript_8858:53-649(+)
MKGFFLVCVSLVFSQNIQCVDEICNLVAQLDGALLSCANNVTSCNVFCGNFPGQCRTAILTSEALNTVVFCTGEQSCYGMNMNIVRSTSPPASSVEIRCDNKESCYGSNIVIDGLFLNVPNIYATNQDALSSDAATVNCAIDSVDPDGNQIECLLGCNAEDACNELRIMGNIKCQGIGCANLGEISPKNATKYFLKKY